MYSIYSKVDGKEVCIHDDSVADQSIKVLEPVLHLSDSGAGSLTFKLAPNSLAYGKYDSTEKIVRGIENVGSEVNFISHISDGGLDDAGEEIETDYQVRTNSISCSNADSVMINIGNARTVISATPEQGSTSKWIDTPVDLDSLDFKSVILDFTTVLKPVFFSTDSTDFEQGGLTVDHALITTNSDTDKVRILIPFSAFDALYAGMNHSDTAQPDFLYHITVANDIHIEVKQSNTNAEGTQYRGGSNYEDPSTAKFNRNMSASGGAYWIEIHTTDGSNIEPSDITSFELELELGKVYCPVIKGTLYRDVEGTPTEDHVVFTQYDFEDVTFSTRSSETGGGWCDYLVISYGLYPRYWNGSEYIYAGDNYTRPDVTPDMVQSASYGVARPVQYKVYEYDVHDRLVEESTFLNNKTNYSFGDVTVSFRITAKDADDGQIHSSDIQSATYQLKAQVMETVTKQLDLVGRLTSTITVKRSTFATSKRSNGVFNVQKVIDITDKFENGLIDTSGNDVDSEYGIRSSKIPVNITMADYLNVRASIRNEGVDADASESSTARRSCGYQLHFYNGNAYIGMIPDDDPDGLIDNGANMMAYVIDHADSVRVVIRPTNETEKLNVNELDFVKFHSTDSAIENADVGPDGTPYETHYAVMTKELELTYAANTTTNIWTAQIDGQSRSGKAFEWGLAMYDSNHNFLGAQKWLDQHERFDGLLGGTKYIRILLQYARTDDSYNYKTISYGDVTVLNVTCLYMANTRVEKEIWEGRVLHEANDFHNLRVLTCEGELAYLNDTRQPPMVYANVSFGTYIRKLISVHNSKAAADKKFVVGTTWEPTKKKGSDPSDPQNEDITTHTTNFETTLELINNLVSDYGGHLRIRKEGSVRYIDWLEDYPNTSNQVIKFGSNLLDFTREFDMSEVCTAVYPTGKVLVAAKSTAVGDHVPMDAAHWTRYENTLLYQDENDKRIYMESGSKLYGYLTVIATVDPSYIDADGKLVEKNYYISTRLHGGYVAYWLTDSAGNMFNKGIELAGNKNADTGFVDYIDKKITMPVGANKVWMCCFGGAIPLALKKEAKEVNGIDEVVTVEDVNTDVDANGKVWHVKGSPYVTNADLIEKYGWIEHRLNLTGIEDKDALYNAAKQYVENGMFDKMVLDVSAVDLNTLGVDTEYINLLDKVRVVSEPHGLDQYFPVTEIEIPLNDPASQTFTLGTEQEQTLSGQSASTNTELLQKIEKAPTTDTVVKAAIQNAAAAIANATTGSYINYLYDSDGHMKEMIISEVPPTDASDPTTIPSGSTWRWNNVGLAHSDGGYDPVEFAKQANIAITSEGQVLANEIMGKFIFGYLIGAGSMVVGSNVGNTEAAIRSLLPPNQPSAISIRNGGLTGSYIDFYDGTAWFGHLDNGGRVEGGRIHGWINVSGYSPLVMESQGNNGLIILNAKRLWLGIGESGFDHVTETVGSGQDVTLNLSNLSSITVRNGMIIDYT